MEDVMPNSQEHSALISRLEELEAENRSLRGAVQQNAAVAQCYRRLFDNAPVGMYEIDMASGRCVSVNRSILDFTGYSREEFLSLPMAEFLTEISLQDFMERFEKIQRGEKVPPSVQYQIRIKDGRTIWAQFEVQYFYENDSVRGASVVVYNINDHKQALMALEESENRFRRLVETMKEGLIILDNDGRILYVNQHLENISGYRSDELFGRNVQDFLPPDVSKLIYQRLTGQERNRNRAFEIRWKSKNGEPKYSIISPQILPVGDGGIKGSFAVITDITAKKETENILRQREQELQKKNDQLEKMNIALRKLVNMRESDKAEFKNALAKGLHQLVDPIMDKLRKSGLNDRQKIYVDLLSANLKEMTAPFGNGISPHLMLLTPGEIEVANLVKHGRTTKEIASVLNISSRTVDMHRLNIRRKLGLHRTSTNLRTYLLSR